MTGREAKREAWFHAGLILDSALSEGWPHGEESVVDRDRVARAMQEIVEHCFRRGWVRKRARHET